jgi:alpha-1,2-mannosyltransferase
VDAAEQVPALARASARAVALAGFLVLLVLLAAVAAVAYDSAGNDFRIFRTAAARFWAGADLYPAADGFYAWRYAPGAAVLFSPFAALPHAAARAVWLGTIVLMLVGIVALLSARLPPRAWWAAPVAAVALLNPIAYELQHGQANVLALALALAALELDDRGKPLRGGALLAWAISLKVTPVLLAAELLLRRRWRALAGVAVGLALVVAVPVLAYGPAATLELHLRWFAGESVSAGQVLDLYRNQSIPSLLARVGAPRVLGGAAALLVVLLAATAPDPRLRRGLLFLAVPLASPYGWVQNYVFALPLVATLVASRTRIGWAALALAAGTTLVAYDVIGRRASGWVLDTGGIGVLMTALFVLARAAPSAATIPTHERR